MAGTHKELIQVTQDELTKLEGERTRKCKYCGKSIWYETTKISFREDGNLSSEFRGTTWRTSKTIDDVTYFICVCQHCLEKMYPDFVDRNKKKIFNTFNKYVQYAFVGINCAVAFLIIKTAIEMFIKLKKNFITITIFALAFILLVIFEIFSISVSSIYFILVGGIIGIIIHAIKVSKENKEITK